MKSILPYLWFGLAALELVLILLQMSSGTEALSALETLIIILPGAITGLLSAVLIGFVYLLIIQTRPSPAAIIFGSVHLVLALVSKLAQFTATQMRNDLIANANAGPDAITQMSLIFGTGFVLSALGLITGIIAVIIALNTKPAATAEVF